MDTPKQCHHGDIKTFCPVCNEIKENRKRKKQLKSKQSKYADKKLIDFLKKEEKAIEKGKSISADDFLKKINLSA